MALPWNTTRYDRIRSSEDNNITFLQLEKMDNEKSSWCACGHTLDNTYTIACLPSLTYKFRVTAVNRLGDSEPLVSENISLPEGVDSSVRSVRTSPAVTSESRIEISEMIGQIEYYENVSSHAPN